MILERPARQANEPLTEPTFCILLSPSPGRKHGRAILRDMQLLSHDRVALSTGTFYGSLKRLLEQGRIIRVDEYAKCTRA